MGGSQVDRSISRMDGSISREEGLDVACDIVCVCVCAYLNCVMAYINEVVTFAAGEVRNQMGKRYVPTHTWTVVTETAVFKNSSVPEPEQGAGAPAASTNVKKAWGLMDMNLMSISSLLQRF